MRSNGGRSVRNWIRNSSVAVLFLSATSGSVLGQQQNPPPPAQPRPNAKAEFEKYKEHKHETDARETDLKLAEKGAKELDSNKESLTMKRLSDSFVRLQTASNEIVQAVKSDPTLDYLRVRDAAAEINKCAQRLKSDLVFPETNGKKNKRDDSDDTDVKASLNQLDVLVKGFVTNPFLTKGLQDEALGTKASRDLDQIIELSNSIRKHSEKLSKIPLKP